MKTVVEKIFNRDMFNVARGARGFSQSELASRSNVTQALISKLENGLTVDPTEETVSSIAKALDFPIHFFYSDEKPHGLPPFHYRKRQKVGKKTLAKIEADINLRRIHLRRLFRSFEHQGDGREIPIIDMANNGWTPKDAAQHMRGFWMVPRGPVENVTRLIEVAGGVVIKIDFGTRHLEALSFRLPGMPPLIFINENLDGALYRHVLAHELGHLIMHNYPETDDCMEAEADEFAAEFLTPANEIKPYISRPSLGRLARAKPYWKVSIKALIVRCDRLKLITPNQYTGLNINYSKAGYSRGEPFSFPQEDSNALSTAIEFHLFNLGYSIDDMASLLMITEDQFEEIYKPKPRLRVVK
ncbi:ImmA/IrrE family metallo-endopeptidase [Sneathiella sp.]|uniref:ImmA/IrrE family metallo-endopeptidase n=1 Tax=Sneathiella sp. TaxID=1964365 RepID=UPI003563491E